MTDSFLPSAPFPASFASCAAAAALAVLLTGCGFARHTIRPLPFADVTVVATDPVLAQLVRDKTRDIPKSGDKIAVLTVEEHFSSSIVSRGKGGQADKLRFDYSLGYGLTSGGNTVHNGSWRNSRTVTNDERTALANRHSRELMLVQMRKRALGVLVRELALISVN